MANQSLPSARRQGLKQEAARLAVIVCALGCQPSRPATPVVTVAPETPPPERASQPKEAAIPPQPASAYLVASHGCARLEESLAQDLLQRANAAIKKAGEHPTAEDLDEILPLLHQAAYGGHLSAQRRFGYYVVGYWYTDEMFWPRTPSLAVAALAMLRVAAQQERASSGGQLLDDPLLEAMARDPVNFDNPDGPPPLPNDWTSAAVEEARRWTECVQTP